MIADRKIHRWSLEAWHAGRDDLFPLRTAEVLHAISSLTKATDREVATCLGYRDLNAVRPRITELHKAGVLEEIGHEVDPVTNRTTRVSRIVPWSDPAQLTLPL